MTIPVLPTSSYPTNLLSTSVAGSTLVGAATVKNQLSSHADRVTMIGGARDDTYYAFSASNKAIEASGGGIDTVLTWGGGFTLGANVENLFLRGTAHSYAVGNSGNNIIRGSDGNNWIHAGGGLDVVKGGLGKDIFLPGDYAGATTWITDLSTGDTLDLTGHGFRGVAQARAAMSQVGTDVKVDLGSGQTVMVANRTIADISDAMIAVEPAAGSRTLTFSDEFNSLSLNTGAAGTSGNRWKTTFYGGERTLRGNNELEYYVDPDFKGSSGSSLGINPFSVSNGVLKISARPVDASDAPYLYGFDYTSGLLTSQTSFQQKYGYFEVRADTPAGKGLFPAFWLLAPAKWPPEIDVFEQIGSSTKYVSQGIASVAGSQNKGTTTGIDMTQGFHIYGMEWTSQNITWFIDGKQTFKVATPADMHQPMYVLLNLAVGGNWPGTPDASVDWSKADLLVDYVRAYSLNSTTTPPSSPTPSSPATTLLAVSQGTDPFDTTTRVDLEIGAANTGRVYRIDDGQGGTADVAVVFDAQRDLYLANRGDWNAVKNALVFDTPGRGVEVRNFVNVQIGTGDADDVVKVAGAKRGSISTGAGDDDVSITGFSSGTTSNVMNVLGGSDDDTIDFDGGGFNVARLDGGSGNDELQIAGGARGTLIGGTGDDRLVDVSTGAVTISGGGGADDFVFGRDANATVTDFAAGVDQVTLIGVSSAEVGVTLAGADTLLDLGGGSVRLTGINLSRAELDLHFV